MKMRTYTCVGCGNVFEATTGAYNKKYCSPECYSKATGSGYYSRIFGLNTGQIGAISELLVCADLLKRGFEVFRSVSQSSTCDLIALKANKTLRIEVRTGYRAEKRVSWPSKAVDKGRSDITAVVVKDEVLYPNGEPQ